MNSATISSNVVIARANLLMLRRSLKELRAEAEDAACLEDIQRAMKFATEIDLTLWRLQHDRAQNDSSDVVQPRRSQTRPRPRAAG